jgi:hypothetical protein
MALADSDRAGDIAPFLELILDRVDAALTGLEISARKIQGYNPVLIKIQKQQEQQLSIWMTGVELLGTIIEHQITKQVEAAGGFCQVKIFRGFIELEEYIELCSGRSIRGGWAFIVNINIPGLPKFEKLAFIQPRSSRMAMQMGNVGGPSIYWSRVNPGGAQKWTPDLERSPFAREATTKAGRGDEWMVMRSDGSFVEQTTTELAESIADALISQIGS